MGRGWTSDGLKVSENSYRFERKTYGGESGPREQRSELIKERQVQRPGGWRRQGQASTRTRTKMEGSERAGGEADHLEAPGGYAIWHGHHRRLSPSPVLSPTNPALPLPSLPASSFVPSVHLCSRRQPSYFRRRLEGNVYASVKLAS